MIAPFRLQPALAALLMVGALSAYAEVRVLGVEFDPPDFTVGQEVTMTLSWDAAGKHWQPERLSDGLPESANGPTLLWAETFERRGRPALSVRFIAWRPGAGALPALSLSGREFPPITLEAASILDRVGRAAPEPFAQLEPGGLRSRLYLLAGSALLFCLFALFAALKLLPWLRALMAHWAFLRARKEFDGVIQYLRDAGEQGADAWAVLARALKRYLGSRSALDFFPLTSSEIAALPVEKVAGGVLPDAAAILSAGDYLRFGARASGDLYAALDLASSLADRLERALTEEQGRKRGAKP
jgi:hypothetical protein